MTTITPVPVERWTGQPAGFDRHAADVVYKAIMACEDDDQAALLGRIIVEGFVQHTLIHHGDELAKAADVVAKRRGETLRKQAARSAVRKMRAGKDAGTEIAQIVMLAKAFSDEDRRRLVEQESRDRQGRFVRTHSPIAYDGRSKPLDPRHAQSLGVPNLNGALKGEDLAHYQQAYSQLDRILAPFHGLGDTALTHLHIEDADGNRRTVLTGVPALGGKPELGGHLKEGERLHTVSESVNPPVTAAGAAFDAMQGLGSPTAAGIAHNSVERGALSEAGIREYGRARDDRQMQDEFVPSQRVFRQLAAGSKLLQDSLGDAAPRKVQYALKVGEHVGRYGPEAQKVLGPTADRAAYRYRGTERAVPRPLANALVSIARNPKLPTPEDKREYLVGGVEGDTPKDWTPSGVLEYFRRQLPAADLNNLHLKSGAVPPSRGIVLDRHGRVSVEAVGYGDDHYLPFNLKGRSFRSLKGGEYIRTRTFGGPTTEDIYGGLLGGAQSLTVVSHNGVYTVNFAKDLKGGKRFNDNAARMVGRYGHLLDAVRSGQVETGGIDPSRYDELKAKANSLYPEESYPDKYDEEVKRLVARERKNPTLSHDQKVQTTLDFFNAKALEAPGAGLDGNINPDALVNAYVTSSAEHLWFEQNKRIAALDPATRRHMAETGNTGQSLEEIKAAVRTGLTDTDPVTVGAKVATALGMSQGLNAAITQAEAANRQSLTPLELNGEGYERALTALQEEFPHYFDGPPQFHPWKSSRGPLDTGYTRPGANRAAEVLSGLFDPRRGGAAGGSKVYADTTRWQNGHRDPVAFLSPARRVEEKDKTERKTSSGGTLDPATAVALKTKASRDLFDVLHDAPNFAAGASGPGRLQNHGGGPIAAVLGAEDTRRELASGAPNLVSIRDMTPEQFDAAFEADPKAMELKLAAAKDEARRHKLLEVPYDVAGAFDRGGAPAELKHITAEPGSGAKALNTPDAEFDFDGHPALAPGTRATPEVVVEAYRADPRVKLLLDRGDLPESPGSSALTPRTDALILALKQRRDRAYERGAKGYEVAPELAHIDREAEGVLRARQYGRRHNDAAEEAVAAQVDEAMEPTILHNQTNILEVHRGTRQEWMSDEDWAKAQDEEDARIGALAGNGKVQIAGGADDEIEQRRRQIDEQFGQGRVIHT